MSSLKLHITTSEVGVFFSFFSTVVASDQSVHLSVVSGTVAFMNVFEHTAQLRMNTSVLALE